MDSGKMTEKSRLAMSDAHDLAVLHDHQELRPLHVFAALLDQEDGLLRVMLDKTGVAADLRARHRFPLRIDDDAGDLQALLDDESHLVVSGGSRRRHVRPDVGASPPSIAHGEHVLPALQPRDLETPIRVGHRVPR